MDLHIFGLPVSAKCRDLAVVVHPIGEDSVELRHQAVGELNRQRSHVGALVPAADGALEREHGTGNRNVGVPELLDSGLSAVTLTGRIDDGRADGILHDGVVSEVVEPGLLVAPGDRVLASIPVGGFAEVAIAPASLTHRLPDSMTFEEGAALPIVYPTSYAALIFRGALQPGETLLVPIYGELANMEKIFTLDSVAAFIWEQLDGKKSLEDIRDGVLDAFDVKKEQAETDIFEFIDELLEADLDVQRT